MDPVSDNHHETDGCEVNSQSSNVSNQTDLVSTQDTAISDMEYRTTTDDSSQSMSMTKDLSSPVSMSQGSAQSCRASTSTETQTECNIGIWSLKSSREEGGFSSRKLKNKIGKYTKCLKAIKRAGGPKHEEQAHKLKKRLSYWNGKMEVHQLDKMMDQMNLDTINKDDDHDHDHETKLRERLRRKDEKKKKRHMRQEKKDLRKEKKESKKKEKKEKKEKKAHRKIDDRMEALASLKSHLFHRFSCPMSPPQRDHLTSPDDSSSSQSITVSRSSMTMTMSMSSMKMTMSMSEMKSQSSQSGDHIHLHSKKNRKKMSKVFAAITPHHSLSNNKNEETNDLVQAINFVNINDSS